MGNPISARSVIHSAAIAAVQHDSAPLGELRGARPVPVASVPTEVDRASTSFNEKARPSHAALLLRRALRRMDRVRQEHLLPLIQHDANWAIKHWDDLCAMDNDQLFELLPLLEHDRAWVGDHWHDIRQMDEYELAKLLPLLKAIPEWTSTHWDDLKEMGDHLWANLIPLAQHHAGWASEHLDDLKLMERGQLEHLLPLLRQDMSWTSEHLPTLKEMDRDQLFHTLAVLQYDRTWTSQHLREMTEMPTDELQDLGQFCALSAMDEATGGLHGAVNPYVRVALAELTNPCIASLPKKRPQLDLADMLGTLGASRSTLNPDLAIASRLTERFRRNQQKIPAATFGVENEMFVPGYARSHLEVEMDLRKTLRTENYEYVDDSSLVPDPRLVNFPMEQVTSKLAGADDVEVLQNSLSMLNDWGAFSNGSSGVHIHMGIRQWSAAASLETTEEKSANASMSRWDQDLAAQPGKKAITPYQLLLMKQFLVNMLAMQDDFYQVARPSRFAAPNRPPNGKGMDAFYQDISGARSYDELLQLANARFRFINVNLLAYQKHGTVEVRGFTKKTGITMEVDPNLPVRDLIFMQDVLSSTLHETKKVLLSGAGPETPVEIHPGAGTSALVKEYVQDVFQLEILHALGQRHPEKRILTMQAILQDRHLIGAQALQQAREQHAGLPGDDLLGQHFLAALAGEQEWNPAAIEQKPLKRSASLRTMADGLEP